MFKILKFDCISLSLSVSVCPFADLNLLLENSDLFSDKLLFG